MKKNIYLASGNKQKGATLFTALVFLILMSIVSVSATKLAMLDTLISGNNQVQMQLYQETENDLKQLTTVPELYVPMIPYPMLFNDSTGVYKLPYDSDKPDIVQQITDTQKSYTCIGFSGQAISIGPDVPKCDLYDFQVITSKDASSAKDRHHRGAGKEKPNPNKNSTL